MCKSCLLPDEKINIWIFHRQTARSLFSIQFNGNFTSAKRSPSIQCHRKLKSDRFLNFYKDLKFWIIKVLFFILKDNIWRIQVRFVKLPFIVWYCLVLHSIACLRAFLRGNACKSIVWFCSVQCELNHAVQMVLVDPCGRSYIYVGRTTRNMKKVMLLGKRQL